MPTAALLSLTEIEQSVCEIVVMTKGVSPKGLTRTTTFEELGLDSIDLAEFFMELENRFGVAIPCVDDSPNIIFKTVFTRAPLRLGDIAELVYMQQRSSEPCRDWRGRKLPADHGQAARGPFTQLSDVWHREKDQPLLELLPIHGPRKHYRRRSDGMCCVQIPAATVEIGCDDAEAHPDEGPQHTVDLDAFLIDDEPVSTTAYCRFLNSIGPVDRGILEDWFVLDAKDHRQDHVLLVREADEWRPVGGTERWPMVLVSWYGANAYSLWANQRPWGKYHDEADGFLPSEAQWEYAARGARYQRFPWGDNPPSPDEMQYGQHTPGDSVEIATMAMVDVNVRLGMSPFGLHHMAGNVWQWCRDWYLDSFYHRGDAGEPNPVNRWPTGIRSERGGSWVGPADLCRSSHRRGRPPQARGRCLGFRCISAVPVEPSAKGGRRR